MSHESRASGPGPGLPSGESLTFGLSGSQFSGRSGRGAGRVTQIQVVDCWLLGKPCFANSDKTRIVGYLVSRAVGYLVSRVLLIVKIPVLLATW